MVVYTCPQCAKEFTQKSPYMRHTERKTPCAPPPARPFTVVDLFSGAGGLTMGFPHPDYKVLFGVEHDKHAAQTYAANFAHPMLNADICSLDTDALVATYGKADLVIGGPPCQGFSMAGRRDAKDPRNSLFMQYLRFVRAFDPTYFVMENVPGILTMKTAAGESVVSILQAEVNSIGYDLKWKILLACDYGVPQKRRRVIFLGWKRGAPEPFHPEPTHTKETYVCMRDILLPKEEVPEKYYHSQKMIAGFKTRKERNAKSGKGFGAQFVKDDQPCYTLSARYYKDGSDALVQYSEESIRKLTEKEAARVQSFPDTFTWPCSSVQTYKQIGNAVACKLASAIGGSLLKGLHAAKELVV
jgi:DNA (cytosine-5)-methyltransferase 1